jgi:hypothetical protein
MVRDGQIICGRARAGVRSIEEGEDFPVALEGKEARRGNIMWNPFKYCG